VVRFICRTIRGGLGKLLRTPVRFPALTVNRVLATLSIGALMVLFYVAGAAAMHFQLPSSDYLRKAFIGARAWHQREREGPVAAAPEGEASPVVRVDRSDRTWDGLTLVTTTQGSRATLIDMRGNVVHQWEMPFSRAFPQAPHVERPRPDQRIYWFRCHLYPNGDLLAIYHAENDTPYGYGLVKLDKRSNLLWAYAANAHHDVDVGEDGTIYVLTQKLERTPPAGMDFVPSPYIADYLVVLSPEGQPLAEPIPILEAFRGSSYSLLVADGGAPAATVPPAGPILPGMGFPPGGPGHVAGQRPPTGDKGDILHANSVKVLRRALAAKFPLFKAGQVLISLRSPDALVVLDRHARSVTWAARGPWKAQHDAELLPNGRLLLFDNLGSPRGSRVLEYDPVTQAVPWSVARAGDRPFVAPVMGTNQRLGNGNTLITDPIAGRLFEVGPDQGLVWELVGVVAPVAPGHSVTIPAVTSARRYATTEMTFLTSGTRARP
jgi:hypothetical protein